MWSFAGRSGTETSLERSSDSSSERVQELNTLSSGLMEIMIVLFRSSVAGIRSSLMLCVHAEELLTLQARLDHLRLDITNIYQIRLDALIFIFSINKIFTHNHLLTDCRK